MRVRFAPSPTGRIHLGNTRTAVINWLLAKRHGGEFMLRIDDTDLERSTEAYREGIEADLAWLGMSWDLYAKQSERFEQYDAARDRLIAQGRLYPCYEDSSELDLMRKTASLQSKPFIYNRANYPANHTPEKVEAMKAEGRQAHWRFALQPGSIAWDDMARGPVKFDAENLSDPVLIRADGSYLYTLCSVLDDIDFACTHIVRGEDHVTNTATQVQIFQALGGEVPTFAHVPLVTGAQGEKLSKSDGALAIADLRDEGVLQPITITSFLGRLGTPDGLQPYQDLSEVAAGFDMSKFGKSSPKMDTTELYQLNAKVVRGLSFEAVKDRLDVTEEQWLAIRPNLEKLDDADEWLTVINGPVDSVIVDAAFAAQAASLLPDGVLDDSSWKAWTQAVKDATGRKGKELFQPLRLALTGMERGPEMAVLVPLLGRERILERLGAA